MSILRDAVIMITTALLLVPTLLVTQPIVAALVIARKIREIVRPTYCKRRK